MNGSSLNALVVILIFGSLVTMSFLKFANPLKVNKKANFWLGVSFLLWSTFWMEEIVQLTNMGEANVYAVYILRCIQFLAPLNFYFFVILFTNPLFKLRFGHLKHAILPAIYYLTISIKFFGDYENQDLIQILLLSLVIIQSFLYTLISFLTIRKHQKNILLFSSDIKEINLNWLEYITVMAMIMSVTISLYNIFYFAAIPNLPLNLFILIVIFFMGYYSLKQKEIYPVDEKQRRDIISINESEFVTESKKKIVTDEELEVIKQRINEIMNNQKPYLDSDLNLIKLADLLSITPHQLSYAINTGFNENFFHFINKYRVEEAKELLMNHNKDNLSILGIAFESGFNSKTSFNTTFKKIANQTPSEFKKRSSTL